MKYVIYIKFAKSLKARVHSYEIEEPWTGREMMHRLKMDNPNTRIHNHNMKLSGHVADRSRITMVNLDTRDSNEIQLEIGVEE